MKEHEIWTGTLQIRNGRDCSRIKTVKLVGEELCYHREDKGYKGIDVRVFRLSDGTIAVYKVEWSRIEGDVNKAKIYKIK